MNSPISGFDRIVTPEGFEVLIASGSLVRSRGLEGAFVKKGGYVQPPKSMPQNYNPNAYFGQVPAPAPKYPTSCGAIPCPTGQVCIQNLCVWPPGQSPPPQPNQLPPSPPPKCIPGKSYTIGGQTVLCPMPAPPLLPQPPLPNVPPPSAPPSPPYVPPPPPGNVSGCGPGLSVDPITGACLPPAPPPSPPSAPPASGDGGSGNSVYVTMQQGAIGPGTYAAGYNPYAYNPNLPGPYDVTLISVPGDALPSDALVPPESGAPPLSSGSSKWFWLTAAALGAFLVFRRGG